MATDNINVYIVGKTGVGKTALCLQFEKLLFPELHIPTFGDCIVTTLTVDNSPCRLTILDTAGTEQDLPVDYNPNQDALVLVYDISSVESLEHLETILQQRQNNGKTPPDKAGGDGGNKGVGEDEGEGGFIPILLIGNKADMKDERSVDEKWVTRVAEQYTLQDRIICAKTNTGVVDVFVDAIRLARNYGCAKCTCNDKNKSKNKDKNILAGASAKQCRCYDICATCNRPRNRHHRSSKHKFKSTIRECCTIV